MSTDVLIRNTAKEAQLIIDGLYANGPIEMDSALDQLGLRDGKEIIEDLMAHGENGVAFEHLLYMLIETGISLSPESMAGVESVARMFGMQLHLPKKEDSL